jgi:hypothetical protein
LRTITTMPSCTMKPCAEGGERGQNMGKGQHTDGCVA